MSEGGDLREVDTRSLGDDCVSEITGAFTPSSDGIFNSTPRSGRSLSYIDVSRLHYDISLPATRWERMKGLSQSICDLKILREKQMGRRERNILFEDDFLQEHARKLEEARTKIKALEAKYGSPQRLRRPRSNLSATADRNERAGTNGIPSQGLTTTNFKEGGGAKLSPREENVVHKRSKESSSLELDNELTTNVTRRSLNEGLNQLSPSDDRSESDGGTSAEGHPHARDAMKARAKKQRPVTWADCEELYSSDTNSVSSHGSGWRRRMEMIPERKDGSESLCCRGYEGNQGRPNLDDVSDPNLGFSYKETMLQRQRPTYHTESRHKSYTPEKNKWQSMPNLSANHEYDCNQNRKMMYGEAIPVDPNEDKKKNNSKFGRKSGLYVVNDSPEKMHQELPAKKKITLRRKLFHKNGSTKACPSKYTTVSAPQQAQSMGRMVGLHATNEAAYVVEINRLASGSFGFSVTQKGYSQYKKGIFISKIADKRKAKFFAGLIHVGDELVEINSTSVQDQNLASVNKLINNSEKLLITILPYSSRNK